MSPVAYFFFWVFAFLGLWEVAVVHPFSALCCFGISFLIHKGRDLAHYKEYWMELTALGMIPVFFAGFEHSWPSGILWTIAVLWVLLVAAIIITRFNWWEDVRRAAKNGTMSFLGLVARVLMFQTHRSISCFAWIAIFWFLFQGTLWVNSIMLSTMFLLLAIIFFVGGILCFTEKKVAERPQPQPQQ